MDSSTVRLEFPASGEHLILARTMVAATGARLDYPIDQLGDLKLAVDEACALLLTDSDSDATMSIEVSTAEGSRSGEMEIRVSVRTRRGRCPRRDSFSWTVLSALVDSVESAAEDGLVSITLNNSIATPTSLGSNHRVDA